MVVELAIVAPVALLKIRNTAPPPELVDAIVMLLSESTVGSGGDMFCPKPSPCHTMVAVVTFSVLSCCCQTQSGRWVCDWSTTTSSLPLKLGLITTWFGCAAFNSTGTIWLVVGLKLP